MEPPCFPLPLQDDSFLFHCQFSEDKPCEPLTFDPALDPGYFSAGSGSQSPASSVDSFSFSPSSFSAGAGGHLSLDDFIFGTATASAPSRETQAGPRSESSSESSSVRRKSRSRYPGKKRQTASEREKLRMRDLTKAMHHLRGFLPPSVAPAGQTLTKIETLRLTIRYISHLSAQLGLSEEVLEQRRSAGPAAQTQNLGQLVSGPAAACSTISTISTAQLYPLQPSHQDFTGASLPSESYWGPQQQQHHHHHHYAAFPGCC